MKSLAELESIRETTLNKINLRSDKGGTKVVINMGTCGIVAGARETMRAMVKELKEKNINHVTVTITGCQGDCDAEPIVTVIENNGTETMYANIDAEKAIKIVNEHIINQKVCEELKK